MKNKKFDYLFYLDVEGNIKNNNLKLAIDELKYFSENLIFLGSYKKYDL